MSDKRISPLAIGLGLGGAALLLYAVMQPATGTGSNVQVPGGGVLNSQWGQWTNTTGQPVWVTATGVIVNGAGDLVGNIADLIAALNQGGGGSGDGSAGEESGGMGKVRIGANRTGAYYNPPQGALM